MPEITTCPECEKKLKAPDDLIGMKVRCPGCRLTFIATPDEGDLEEPASRSSTPNGAFSDRRSARDDRDDFDDDYDRRPRRSDQVKGWRGTRAGLNLVIVGNWLLLGAIGMAVLGAAIMVLVGGSMLAGAASGSFNEASAARAGTGLMGAALGWMLYSCLVWLMILASSILHVVGQGLCMQVPARAGASLRPLAIAAFACSCAAILGDIGSFGVGGYYAGWGGAPVILFGGVLHLASYICWMIFLRVTAFACRNPDLANRLLIFLITSIVLSVLVGILLNFVVCGGVLAITQTGSLRDASAVGVIVLLLVGVFFLVQVGLMVWYCLLMQQVRSAIERHLVRL